MTTEQTFTAYLHARLWAQGGTFDCSDDAMSERAHRFGVFYVDYVANDPEYSFNLPIAWRSFLDAEN